MKPCIATWLFLVWVGIGAIGVGATSYCAAQACYWKRKYLALRNSPMLREIERQLQEEKSK